MLVIRNTTERPEVVESGSVRLVGVDKENIVSQAQILLDNGKIYQEMSKARSPYGDGDACAKIVEFVKK